MRMAAICAGMAKAMVRPALWFCALSLPVAVLVAQCPNAYQVPNQVINSGTASFSNDAGLTTSNVVISGSASVTFYAGNCIVLQPGFNATAGATGTTFLALIEAAPGAISVSPASGSGFTQAFTWTVSSASGYSNLSDVYALFNTSVSLANACYIHYNRASNLLYVADSTGANWSAGIVPGGSGTTGSFNPYCTVNGTGSGFSASGTQLAVTASVTFSGSSSGTLNDYLNAYDNEGLTTTWQQVGTWTVPPPSQYYLTTAVSPVGGGSISPASGWYNTGSQVTVTATAASGYTFTGFSGSLTGTSPQNLTMNGTKSVTANFSGTLVSAALPGGGPNLATISTRVPYFPSVQPPSGSLPAFSPTAYTLINATTINTFPQAVVQNNGGNNVAIFNVSGVTIPAGVTVEVADFDFVVFNSAGSASVAGTIQSDGPRVAVVGSGDQTVDGSLQAMGGPGGAGTDGNQPVIIGAISGAGGNGGVGGNGGSATAGTNGYNGQGGNGGGGGGGGGWPIGATANNGNGPENSPGAPYWNPGSYPCPNSGGSAGGSNGTQGAQGGGTGIGGVWTPAPPFGSAYVGLDLQPSGGGSGGSGGCAFYYYYQDSGAIYDGATGGGAGGGGVAGAHSFSQRHPLVPSPSTDPSA
jgi:List-Bact-rpt repeat protein